MRATRAQGLTYGVDADGLTLTCADSKMEISGDA